MRGGARERHESDPGPNFRSVTVHEAADGIGRSIAHQGLARSLDSCHDLSGSGDYEFFTRFTTNGPSYVVTRRYDMFTRSFHTLRLAMVLKQT